jgi:hypothetical protein
MRRRAQPARLLGDDSSTLALARELDELDGLLGTADEVAQTLPHRETYLRINHRLARRLVAAHREWLGAIERELGE